MNWIRNFIKNSKTALNFSKMKVTERPFVENIWFDDEGKRLKPNKFPIVLCFSYIGTDFHGMSFTTGKRTVSSVLQQALVNIGVIPKDKKTATINWCEATRTDSGVSAVSQIVTLNIGRPENIDVTDIKQLLQDEIDRLYIEAYQRKEIQHPILNEIRIWNVLSIGSGFNSKQCATSRRYFYMLPLNALKEQTDEHLNFLKNEIMPLFLGTHTFINYTRNVADVSKGDFVRTITEFNIGDPFEVNGEKFVLFCICGNSFILNQLRKMVAAVVSASHGLFSKENVEESLTERRWGLPMVPGIGLFLDQVFYTNCKIVKQFPPEIAPVNKDVHFRSFRPEMEKWKKEVLFPRIAEQVKDENIFDKWIKESLFVTPPCHLEDLNYTDR